MAVKRIYAGWLMDGTGGPIVKDVCVEIAGGKIRSITRRDPEKAFPVEGLDFTGCTLIPGLIDCHVHLCMSGSLDKTLREGQLSAGFEAAAPRIAQHLAGHLASGIVAVRDGGDPFGHAMRFKKGDGRGAAPPVRLFVAGKAWHARGRYGSLIGRPPADGQSLARAVERKSSGLDWIKIVNSGINSLLQYGRQTPAQFNEKTLSEAVAAARARGLPVMVHANGVEPVRSAVSAGVRSIEHGYFMGTDNLKRMRDQAVTWVPTAFAMKAFTDPAAVKGRILKKGAAAAPSSSSLEVQSRIVAEKTLAHQLDQIRRAKELGVKIALGTDAGSMGVNHGASMKEEIALLCEAGFSLPEAVHCAAESGADLLGLEGMGLLAPGKAATFLAVPGAPGALPGSLHGIAALFMEGAPVPVDK